MSEVHEVVDLLRIFFDRDPKKIHAWLNSKNPMLGDISPMQMIHLGREKKLLEFVRSALAENERPPT